MPTNLLLTSAFYFVIPPISHIFLYSLLILGTPIPSPTKHCKLFFFSKYTNIDVIYVVEFANCYCRKDAEHVLVEAYVSPERRDFMVYNNRAVLTVMVTAVAVGHGEEV